MEDTKVKMAYGEINFILYLYCIMFIFDNSFNMVSLISTYGRKYGLVGRNGIGKTCFMNALARGEFEATPGHIQILLVE